MTDFKLLLDEANEKLEPAMEELRKAVAKKLKFIDEKKEEFVSAFIAETGFKPSEVVMIQQEIKLQDKLATRIWFEKKPDDLPTAHRETEHKFGTWYPIEELKEFDKNVLLYEHGQIDLGFLSFVHGGKGYIKSFGYCGLDYINPSHFMPLPPRPGEEPKPDTLAMLVKSMANIDPEIEKTFKKNIRDLA
jgi:hypothetical protein